MLSGGASISTVEELLKNLNEAQQEAVQHPEGPAMVLAGAGSGKTTVLTTRVAWLVKQNLVQPQNLLVVTFTNKASGELKQRIAGATNHNLPFAGTFHSLSARILRKNGSVVGLNPDFTIYDADDQNKLIKQIYLQHNIDAKKYNLQAVRASISNAKNEIISPQDYAQFAQGDFQEKVAEIYKWYQQSLTENQAVDFDDLLLKTLELLRANQYVREFYQQQFEHVLVDEYQDTNKVQYELTKTLSSPHNNLYVVGDFSQSIYAWRGADYRNMLLLKQDFANIAEYRLEQNYRSNQTILDAASQVISHNTKHPVLTLWTTKALGNKISVIATRDGYEEAEMVARLVRQESAQTPLEEMAVLYRTNAQSRVFEEAFIKSGIPYALIGGTKFYERKEVRDLLAYLKYLANPTDSVSLERITNLGKRRLQKFLDWLTEKKAQILQTAPSEILETILKITDYQKKYSAKTEENYGRLENISELLNVASQFTNITQLLENIALIQDSYFTDGREEGRQQVGVRLMSFHAVKGLEFEVVFMVGMEEGLLPHSRSFLELEQMEEERRLCYVGITRAKSKLYCTYASKRFQFGFGGSNYGTPSRFLRDIPDELVDFSSTDGGLRAMVGGGESEGDRSRGVRDGKGNYDIREGQKKRKIVPVDDALAEAVLNGEIELDEFLEF